MFPSLIGEETSSTSYVQQRTHRMHQLYLLQVADGLSPMRWFLRQIVAILGVGTGEVSLAIDFLEILRQVGQCKAK